MTERVRIEHTFDCTEKAFWDTFLNEDYNKEMFCERMRFPRWEVLSCDINDEEMTRVVHVEPYVAELPGPIKKVIGDNIAYREEGRLDRKANRYKLKIVPSKLVDKILVSGEQFTEAIGEDRCRRVFLADVQVKIFGIGGLIEKNIVSDMRKSYDVGATFTQNYMRQHGIS